MPKDLNSPTEPAATSIRVATRMAGGVGNQLFQYAAGRALAARLGARLVIDCTLSSEAARRFVLDRYPIDADIVRDAPGKPRRRHFRLPGRLGRRLTDAFHDHVPTTYRIAGHRYKVFGERRELHYDPQFERLTGSTYLIGDWQSYRFSENAADLIRDEIRPAWPLSDANRNWLGRIESVNAVCLHVRRGDYLTHQGPPMVCARSYYEAALAHARRVLQQPRFFVFSDDIAWCREIFVAPDMAFVDANGPDDAVDDLRLMAACRHHITANSSLSWWGAWLAWHPEQVVIAPDPWVPWVPANPDLLPKHWLKLPRI
jgi:hypothetical protein